MALVKIIMDPLSHDEFNLKTAQGAGFIPFKNPSSRFPDRRSGTACPTWSLGFSASIDRLFDCSKMKAYEQKHNNLADNSVDPRAVFNFHF
jgi:hypothetical protein